MYSDNLTQKVAQAAAKIMDEELKGKQHKIDANKNGKVDAEDFKLLKAKKEVKEESEQIDELSKKTLGSYVNKSAKDAVDRTAQEVETGEIDKLADKRMSGIKLATKKLAKEETDQVEEGYYKTMDTNRKEDERLAKKDSSPFGKPDKKKTKIATAGKFGYGYSAARHLARQGMATVTKEETEQVDEVIQKTSSGYIHHARPGVYGGSEKEKHVVDTLRGPKKSELNAIEKEKKMKKFSEMVELYNEIGLKSLSTMISEEPDNEQFTQELKDQQAKSEGKGKKVEVAKGAVQAVKQEEVEQLDELSPKTLGSYIKKANKDVRNISADHEASEYRQARRDDGVSAKEIGDPDSEKDMRDNERRLKTRDRGVKKATNKLIKKAIGENVEEETEQLDELSSKTLG